MKIAKKIPDTTLSTNKPDSEKPNLKNEIISALRGRALPKLASGFALLALAGSVKFVYDAFFNSACPCVPPCTCNPIYKWLGIIEYTQ